MQQFGEQSSIHGVKYVLTNVYVKSTRIFWCCALLFSFSGFMYNICMAYKKWQFDPQIVMKSRDRISSEFPLPAVTLCSNVFVKDDIVNFQDVYIKLMTAKPVNLTEKQCQVLTANLLWCQPDLPKIAIESCSNFDIKNINVIQIIDKNALQVAEAFYICRDGRCDGSIFRHLTDFGICYSSNMLGSKAIYNYELIHDDLKVPISPLDNMEEIGLTWTPERGYINSSTEVPMKAERGNGMTFYPVLNEVDQENVCSLQTFRIYFHKPNEIPTPYHESIYLNYGDFMEFKIFPTSHRTDEILLSYPAEKRKCYFEGEFKLKFFKTYTKALCEWECKTNLTLEKCGCVKFSMPRDQNTKICDIFEMNCVKEVPNAKCNCFVPCIDVRYSYKVDRTKFNRKLYAAHLPQQWTMAWVDISAEIEIVEEIENFVSYKWSNFISDFGGLLGLFMGCSLLSIIEIFYYLVYGVIDKIAKPNDIDPDIEKNHINNEKWATKKTPQNISIINDGNDLTVFGKVSNERNIKQENEKVKKSFKLTGQQVIIQKGAFGMVGRN